MLPRAPGDAGAGGGRLEVDLRDAAASPAEADRSGPGTTEPEVAEPAVAGPDVEAPGVTATDGGGGAGAVGRSGVLGERDLAVLALERRRYRNQGAKEQAVRDELGLSATRYYQVLNALLDDERALAHDPVLVGRLRRLRQARTSGSASR